MLNNNGSAFTKKRAEQILDSGFILFGAAPVDNWQDSTNISRTVRENLKNNVNTTIEEFKSNEN